MEAFFHLSPFWVPVWVFVLDTGSGVVGSLVVMLRIVQASGGSHLVEAYANEAVLSATGSQRTCAQTV